MIHSASLSAPANVGAGTPFAVTDTTKNQGGGPADASLTAFYLSTNAVLDALDVPLGSRSVPALGPGVSNTGSVTITIPAGTPGGTYYLLARADAMRLPIPDRSFDAATIAFGIRNVADPVAGCRELHRILRAGGRAAILEFGMPSMPIVSGVYAWYFRAVLPRVGRLISRHSDAYEYLPASVSSFPSGEGFVNILREAGFSKIRSVPLVFGAVYLYIAERAEGGASR